MRSTFLVALLTYAEFFGCLAAICFIVRRKQFRSFRFLAVLLFVRMLSLAILVPVVYLSQPGGWLSKVVGYILYFYAYWISYTVEAVLGFAIIYSLFQLAMEPLPGLQRLGTIMFRWAAGIAVALALTAAAGPHISTTSFILKFVSQLQQTQSVLTLCMLTFVILASKPMGLSHRSKIVGVSIGLGILAVTDLIGSNWLSHFAHLVSVYNIMNGVAICSTLAIWITYFAMPEPERRMIVLPTTSPFLRWNQISQVLGDEPGFVVVGRVTPEMFAPAEVEIMLRASAKIAQQSLPAAG